MARYIIRSPKDRYDKFKIWAEVIAVAISLLSLIVAGIVYYGKLNVNKSMELYDDFVINGLIPLEVNAVKLAYAHFGTQNPISFNRYRSIVSQLNDVDSYKEILEKKPDTKIKITPLTCDEKKQIKIASEKAIDLLNSRLFFLGQDITFAINYSINLLRDERAFISSPEFYFSPPNITGNVSNDVLLSKAYRYYMFVNANHRFLRDSLKAFANYILKENIHTYKEMAEIQNKTDEDIGAVIKNLLKFKKLYLAYVNNWQGLAKDKILQQNTKHLVLFFEESEEGM